jgi:hypothetical protein
MSNTEPIPDLDIPSECQDQPENLELSRLMYVRDELEVMILKCFVTKKEIGFHELLFWFTEYYKSYGIDDAKCMLEYVATYALYSWDNIYTKMFCRKRVALVPINTDDPIPVSFLTALKTLHFRKVNTAVYVFIKMFVLGSDGNGEWSKLLLMKSQHQVEQLYEKYLQQYQKWRNLENLDTLHTTKPQDQPLSQRKAVNIFRSIYGKHVANIMYYLKHLSKLDWVVCIDTIMQELSDQYTQSCYNLKHYTSFNTLIDVHSLATVLFVKWLSSADTIQFQEGFVNKKKQPVIKHKKQDEEWLRTVEELAMDTHYEEINTQYDYRITPEIKKMYLSGKKTDIDIELEQNMDYHFSETTYWKQHQCTHSERRNLLAKRYRSVSNPSSSSSNYWYIPEWIVNHSETSQKVYKECMNAVQY